MGPWPPTLADAGITAQSGNSQYCEGFTDYQSVSGAFAINVNESAIGLTTGTIQPVLTPTALPSGIVNWRCSNGTTTNVNLLPAGCRDS